MAIFIVDGGFFVGRLEQHKNSNGKNISWWKEQFKTNQVTEEEYKEGIKKIFERMLHHLEYKIRMVDEVDKIIVCYDGIFGRRIRGKLYKNYKRHKKGINPRKHKGIDIRETIKDFGYDAMALNPDWEGVYHEYKEADDIIAEQVQLYGGLGKEVVVMSEDRDMIQFLAWEGNIRLHNFREEITSEYVLNKWGVNVSEYVDWRCLVGDNSDNIPGLPGIGEAKGRKLIAEYKTLENIPGELLILYAPVDLESIALKMWEWREAEGITEGMCKKRFGGYWRSYENKQRPLPLSQKDAHELFEVISVKQYFKRVDYSEHLKIWKKIIELPMVFTS